MADRRECVCGKLITPTKAGNPRAHVCTDDPPVWADPTRGQPIVPADLDEQCHGEGGVDADGLDCCTPKQDPEHACTYAPTGRGTVNQCACGKTVSDGPVAVPPPGKVTDDTWRMPWTRDTGFQFKVHKGGSFRADCGHMILTDSPYRERPEGGVECRGEWSLAPGAPVPSCMYGRPDTLDRVPLSETTGHMHTYQYVDVPNGGPCGSFCKCGKEEPEEMDAPNQSENWNGTGRPRPSASNVKMPEPEPQADKPRLLDTLRKGMEFAEAQDAKGMAGHRDPLDDAFSMPTPQGSGPVRAAAVSVLRDASATPDPFSTPTAVAAPLGSATGQPETWRNSYGQYVIKDPRTGDYKRNRRGKPQGFTRATTFAKTLIDQFGIHQWELRTVLAGLALRPDLVSKAKGLDVAEDKDALQAIISAAKEAAGGNDAASDGTEFHTVTEHLDAGVMDPQDVPEKYKPEAEQYLQKMALAGLTTRPEWIERVLFTDRVGEDVAGTADRILMERNGTHVIGDVKSGKGVDLGQREIAMQLKHYAVAVNQFGLYRKIGDPPRPGTDDPEQTGCWEPWTGPPVSEEYGIVMHVPLVRPEGTPAYCDIYRIDLRGAVPYAVDRAHQGAAWVRGWRKEKGFLSPYQAPAVETLTGHVRAAEPRPAPAVAPTRTWADAFATVTTPEEANRLWQAAMDAGMGDADLASNVALARRALQVLQSQ